MAPITKKDLDLTKNWLKWHNSYHIILNEAKKFLNPIYTGEGWFHPPKQSDALLGMKERSEEAVTIL